jgi:hypothetical protein
VDTKTVADTKAKALAGVDTKTAVDTKAKVALIKVAHQEAGSIHVEAGDVRRSVVCLSNLNYLLKLKNVTERACLYPTLISILLWVKNYS